MPFAIYESKNEEKFILVNENAGLLGETGLIWMGVSVENKDYVYRINDLQEIDARVKFISFEPLLGPITKFPLKFIDWVIVGGESGPYARKMEEDWAITIRDQCIKKKVPYFFKQWGGLNKKKNGRLLEGRMWDEMPVICNT